MTVNFDGDAHAKRQCLLIALRSSFEANGKSMKTYDLELPVSNSMALLHEEQAYWRSRDTQLGASLVFFENSTTNNTE